MSKDTKIDVLDVLSKLTDYGTELYQPYWVFGARRFRERMAEAAVESMALVESFKGKAFDLSTFESVETLAWGIYPSPNVEGETCSVPPSIARLAVAALAEYIIEAKAKETDALYYFLEGDYQAIDLETDEGRSYLFKHYALAVNKPDEAEFAALCAYCLKAYHEVKA